MIPCHICGKDASTGWIKGYTPAPDSQKLALCAEHDNEKNRLAVANAWQAMLVGELAARMSVARQKASALLQTANIHFRGGGMLSFLCTACTPTGHGTLRLDGPDGSRTFIPLQHIREYSLSPSIPETQ
jgi:hypothetical protein